MTDITVTVVPAAPGWHVLEPVRAEDGRVTEFYRMPVIAWRVETFRAGPEFVSSAYPVGVESADADKPIEQPDGRVIIAGIADFPSAAEALKHLNDHPEE